MDVILDWEEVARPVIFDVDAHPVVTHRRDRGRHASLRCKGGMGRGRKLKGFRDQNDSSQDNHKNKAILGSIYLEIIDLLLMLWPACMNPFYKQLHIFTCIALSTTTRHSVGLKDRPVVATNCRAN